MTSMTSPYLCAYPPPPPPLAAEEALSSCLCGCLASQIPYIPAHTSFPYLVLCGVTLPPTESSPCVVPCVIATSYAISCRERVGPFSLWCEEGLTLMTKPLVVICCSVLFFSLVPRRNALAHRAHYVWERDYFSFDSYTTYLFIMDQP